MQVVALVPRGKSKIYVELDDARCFALSLNEIRDFGIALDMELTEEEYKRISEYLYHKTLRKCADLLSRMDYTRKGLWDKLIMGGCPKEAAVRAVEAMEKAHYVDDRRFTRHYLEYHMQDRSRERMKTDLLVKGVPQDVMEEEFASWEEEFGEESQRCEILQICALMKKRRFDAGSASGMELQKMETYLHAKGYETQIIREAMEQSQR